MGRGIYMYEKIYMKNNLRETGIITISWSGNLPNEVGSLPWVPLITRFRARRSETDPRGDPTFRPEVSPLGNRVPFLRIVFQTQL